MEKSSKTIDFINVTILVAAVNQKPASISTLEKYYVTGSFASSAVITKDKRFVKRALRRFATKPRQQYSVLFTLFLIPLNQLELKQWMSGFIGIDSHRHSEHDRRPGWIDLTMKTTTNSHPHLTYIYLIQTLRHKEKFL